MNSAGKLDRYWLTDKDSIVFAVVYPETGNKYVLTGTPIYGIQDKSVRGYFQEGSDNAIFLVANPDKIKIDIDVLFKRTDNVIQNAKTIQHFFSRINANYISIPVKGLDGLVLFVTLSDSTSNTKLKDYKIEFSKDELIKLLN